ncbi:hypothetical protein GcM1_233033 [Golovinomyces cichoracearum]|uniref:STE24 endopeptidase n=1 Tax=Golovinomyces cichoracearum TaxID=62708 RepID=A0A420ILV5_9PEZI|nr:hypothetical protein GcM1_233033 [Golovinomyces cichoracearum]
MPTSLDRALNQRSSLLAFTGIITGIAAWMILFQDIFPKARDPTGNPETWTRAELIRWLATRDLQPSDNDSNEALLERVKCHLKAPRT